jgi:hypothetical protein
MNFIKSSLKDTVFKSMNLLSSKSSFTVNQQQRNLGVLKKPKKIKGVIEPLPHTKIKLIDNVNQPEYLKYLKPTVPYHGVQNIQIKGYDYVILDGFKVFITRLLKQLDVKMKQKWATPCQELALDKFQNESYGIEETINVNIFERNLQIDELPSYKESILIESLVLSKPPGVTITIEKHDPSVLDKLHMIDMELVNAKEEFEFWSKPWEEIAKTKNIF